MKSALVESHRERWRRIESGELTVVGMNRFDSTEPSPLTADADGGILVVDPAVEAAAAGRRSSSWRAERDEAAVRRGAGASSPRAAARRRREHHAGDDRRRARRGDDRRVVADAARGVRRVPRADRRRRGDAPSPARTLSELRDEVERVSEALGRRLKFLVGKPGLDGHSNGAEQIAVRARDAGHGRRLRGDPPDPAPDRQLRRPGGRARDRALDPLRLARRADPVGARRRCARRGSARSRSSSAASSRSADARRCARPGWPPSTPRRTGISTG